MYRLAQAVRSQDSPAIAAAFDAKLQEYFAGKLPHAKDMVLGLFDLLASNRMSPHQSPPGSSHSTITPYSDVGHGSWIQFRDAITRSLTTGIFIDSMFYVEDSMELRPLFFCMTIALTPFKKISGQYEQYSSMNLSENKRTEIGKLVPVGALHGSSEQVTPRGVNAIASQDQTALVVTLADFRT